MKTTKVSRKGRQRAFAASMLAPAVAALVAGVCSFGSVSANAQVYIAAEAPPPPPPRVEVVPGPRQGYVWDAGHWRWAGRHYAWVPGHWQPVREGRWVPGRWEQHGPRWGWSQGYWAR